MCKLKNREKEGLQVFVNYLNENLPEKIINVALFGSKARGDSHQDSDIDVLVIVKEDNYPLKSAILRKAARISLEYDVLLSPRVIGMERWQKMRGFSLYRNVIQEASSLSLEQGNLVFGSAKQALSVGA